MTPQQSRKGRNSFRAPHLAADIRTFAAHLGLVLYARNI
jgi:hypothetical protein